MTPRPYQIEANEALDDYLATRPGNPCIVLPTGAGKTPAMAWAIQRYCQSWPTTRIIVIAHIRELLEQGVEKMRTIWPAAPIGIYAAGLGRKDLGYSITYASIQSVFKRACDFDPFDLIFIDEAHRIPLGQEGQYAQFLRDAKLVNPNVRVVGWTATPYRLSGGNICHPKYILNDVIYDKNVKGLIDEGYLSPLRTKVGSAEINTAGVKKSKGEYDAKQLSAAATIQADPIAKEAAAILDRENRKSILFFCVTVEHAETMSQSLESCGIHAPTVHAKTPPELRSKLTADFSAGRIRALCNVNVLSEGFDAQRIDAVVLVRPTLSKGLYYQQVGRGLRLHPSKKDCLVIDFAGNIDAHGPIDVLEGERPEMKVCPECRERFPVPRGECICGWKIPPEPIDEPDPLAEPKAGSPRIIPNDPSRRTETPILSGDKPWGMIVKGCTVRKHQKDGKPPSLLVQYEGDFQSHREWICLEHSGYARAKAEQWWKARFGEPVPATVDDALATDLSLGHSIAHKTSSVTVRQAGRYSEIVGVTLKPAANAKNNPIK